MTDMTNAPRPATAGDVLHCLQALTAFGYCWARGDLIQLTPERVLSTIDTQGNSWLDDVSENAQLRRWGSLRVGLGPRPDDLETWVYGSAEWAEARELARRAAWAETDPERRRAALAAVEKRYGPPPVTSTETNAAPNRSIALAAAQEQARRAAGLRQVSTYAPARREV